MELPKLKFEKAKIEEQIKEEKRKEHQKIVREHRKLIRIGDILIILALLFNIGAVMMTNALVIKNEPGMKLVESNPVVANVKGFETTKEASKDYIKFTTLLIFAFSSLLVWFAYLRFYMHSYDGVIVYLLFTFSVFFLSLWDFSNDFGYLIGKVLFGGG